MTVLRDYLLTELSRENDRLLAENERLMNDSLQYRIAKLEVRSGDTLVVKVDQELSREAAANLQRHVEQCVGLGVKVLVVTKGVDLMVLKDDRT